MLSNARVVTSAGVYCSHILNARPIKKKTFGERTDLAMRSNYVVRKSFHWNVIFVVQINILHLFTDFTTNTIKFVSM